MISYIDFTKGCFSSGRDFFSKRQMIRGYEIDYRYSHSILFILRLYKYVQCTLYIDISQQSRPPQNFVAALGGSGGGA